MAEKSPSTSEASRSAATPWASVVRGAIRQAKTDLRIQLFSPMLLAWLMMPAIGLAVLWFLRDKMLPGGAVSIAQLGVPGLLAVSVVAGGITGAAGQLVTERDDGTLLRAKAVPGGLQSHLLGSLLMITGTTLVPTFIMLAIASLVVPGVAPNSLGAWWTLIWVSLLGLVATVPAGVVLGAVLKDAMTMGLTGMVVYASMAISGIFFPLQALPTWLQWVGQLTPAYWVGLGYRSALLPPEAVNLEIGDSWRTGLMILVLAAWALAGLVFVPKALGRLTRQATGSVMAAARERTLARGY